MYDGSDATAPPPPPPQIAPSPATAPSPGTAPSPARYAYLVGRLRGRQITMEEATELFELQQQMVLRARMAAIAVASPAPSGPAPPRPASATGTPAPGASNLVVSEDALWESLPALAGALGIFAALLKRAQSGSGDAPPSSARPASGRGSPPPASR
ncbi:MAG TPA: hypothetical protein VGV89_09960 [Thermoplasmata archaeon]|nr:hypothetical protein [Thermoplasmata archaeon]